MRRDEEHSAWMVMFHDPTNAERAIGVELASQPEYRRFRPLARTIARFNEPPFVVVKNEQPRRRKPTGASCWSTSRTKASATFACSATRGWAK